MSRLFLLAASASVALALLGDSFDPQEASAGQILENGANGEVIYARTKDAESRSEELARRLRSIDEYVPENAEKILAVEKYMRADMEGPDRAERILREAGRGYKAFDQAAPFRQVMDNNEDMDYTANLSVGEQKVKCVMDTGSFELVVFSKKCRSPDCNPQNWQFYDPEESRNYVDLRWSKTLSYGSGDVKCQMTEDLVKFDGTHRKLGFWQVVQANLPILREANFQCIFGLGHPAEPIREARQFLTADSTRLRRCWFPSCRNKYRKRKNHDQEFLDALKQYPTPISHAHKTRFSICLQNEDGAPGYITWNERRPDEHFTTLNVNGFVHWSMLLKSINLHEQNLFGNHCGALRKCSGLIDSGTSLLAMPTPVVHALELQLGNRVRNCDRMHTLPNLRFNLDGRGFELTPDKYIGYLETGDEVDHADGESMRQLFPHVFKSDNSHNLQQSTVRNATKVNRHCGLAVIAMDMKSYHGDKVFIFGMPFLRQFYTIFDYGEDGDFNTRQIHVAPNTNGCRRPEDAKLHGEVKLPTVARTVDISKVRLSPFAQRAMGKDSLSL